MATPAPRACFAGRREGKGVERRGAGPMDASIYGRGAGEGFGVHICTGPIAVKGAEPGDVLEVRILDMAPRPSRNPDLQGRIFGSSVAAWWGYHYDEFLSEPKPREAVTIYEIFPGEEPHAQALYSYRWHPQTDPFGVLHQTYDYPGVPSRRDGPAAARGARRHSDSAAAAFRRYRRRAARAGWSILFRRPISAAISQLAAGQGSRRLSPGFRSQALALDRRSACRAGRRRTERHRDRMLHDRHVRVVLHKKADLAGRPSPISTYPLIETETDWVLTGFSHPNYLAEFGAKGQSEVYAKSSLDLAMKDAFRKVRSFLTNTGGFSEDEAIALISAAVDFGVTQVVDGNRGVHAILSKRLFAELKETADEISHDCRAAEAGRAVQPCGRNRWLCSRHRRHARYARSARCFA